jgi:polysaccharide deacetylase 2 family uncharacterized protein YibQ
MAPVLPRLPPWFWSFRPLAWFWAGVLGVAAGGAVILELAGPPAASAAVAAGHVALPPAPPAAPSEQHAAASPQDAPMPPVPSLAMRGAPIADPNPDLLEPAAGMPGQFLPRVAADGRKPSGVYAAAFDPDERHPRVALLIDGAGLDQAMTRKLLADLPSAIDVAWSAYTPFAYASKLSKLAREQGRECLVSIPMEPSGYPGVDEGSRALLTSATPAVNWQNLLWALTGVQGCVGATGGSDGMLGERFAQSAQAFGEVRAELRRRGLIYLDPGQVDVVIDRASSVAEPAAADAIDERLADLTRAAQEHGSAVGLAGPPRPVVLERIAVWAHGLAAHGVVLAPLTALPKPAPVAGR